LTLAEDELKLIPISRAAAMLGVHPNTLRAWVDRGLVPATRLPSGYRRFTLAQIQAIRASMASGARPERGKAAA
jgi:predicted site-specific integrase-resolvase